MYNVHKSRQTMVVIFSSEEARNKARKDLEAKYGDVRMSITTTDACDANRLIVNATDSLMYDAMVRDSIAELGGTIIPKS